MKIPFLSPFSIHTSKVKQRNHYHDYNATVTAKKMYDLKLSFEILELCLSETRELIFTMVLDYGVNSERPTKN